MNFSHILSYLIITMQALSIPGTVNASILYESFLGAAIGCGSGAASHCFVSLSPKMCAYLEGHRVSKKKLIYCAGKSIFIGAYYGAIFGVILGVSCGFTQGIVNYFRVK